MVLSLGKMAIIFYFRTINVLDIGVLGCFVGVFIEIHCNYH